MILNEVKKQVQPELDQDFDALFEEFVAETGNDDVAAFLVHLHEFGLISDELVQQLADEGTLGFEKPVPPDSPDAARAPQDAEAAVLQPIDWDAADVDDDDADAATVLASASELIEMSRAAAAESSPPPADDPDPLPSTPPPPDEERSHDAQQPDASDEGAAEPEEAAESTSDAPASEPETPELAEASSERTPEPSEPPTAPAGTELPQLDVESGGGTEDASEASAGGPFDPVTPTKPGGPRVTPETHASNEVPPEPPVAPDAGLGGGMGFITPGEDEVETEQDDGESTKKRTMFRKRSDGNWAETDAFTQKKPERRQRRRRRRRQPVKASRDEKRYAFTGHVGEGAMGTVLLAQDRILHRKIAYKEMSDDIAEQAALASKFAAEAQITAQLEHPNIVPVYALEGEDAYTMKLIRGRTVEDLINETKELYAKKRHIDEDHSLEGRLDMFLKVCDAIAFANARGVVHRDLKPENIMLGEFGEVYVMDWGIAHLMDGEYDEKPVVEGMEDEGELIIGTVGYMSPEQADGRTDELTGASDQYALGLILFELISLKEAVTGKNRLHLLTRQQEGETDNLVHAFRERIPSELVAIVQKATRLDPAKRFATVDHLGDDIRRFLRGEAVKAKPDNPWQALVRFTGRHRQLTLLGVMMVVFGSFMLVMLIGIWTQFSLARAAAREQAVSNLVTTVGRQASYVDGKFQRFEGLLAMLGASAEDLLVLGDARDATVYEAEDFGTNGPSDLTQSRRYGVPVSVSRSAFVLPEGISDQARYFKVPKLNPMNRHYNKVLLRSLSEEAATMTPVRAARAITDVGTPIAWAYVALNDGTYNVYPGHGGYDDGYDPKETPWYELASNAKGPEWTLPLPDDDGGDIGTVMSCAMPLFDRQGDRIGVAGIDVDFEFLAEETLPAKELEGTGARTYILDAEGRVILDPQTMKRGMSGREPQLFPNPDVLQGVKQRKSDYVEVGNEIIVYTRMLSADWYYVVRGPADEMLAAMTDR